EALPPRTRMERGPHSPEAPAASQAPTSGQAPLGDQVLFSGHWVPRDPLRSASERVVAELAGDVAVGETSSLFHPRRAAREAVGKALRGAPRGERLAWAGLVVALAVARLGPGVVESAAGEASALRAI